MDVSCLPTGWPKHTTGFGSSQVRLVLRDRWASLIRPELGGFATYCMDLWMAVAKARGEHPN